MSQLFPSRPRLLGPEPAHPELEQRETAEERRRILEVRAAHWRARELAARVFGSVTRSALTGQTRAGPLAGLVRLDVPFEELPIHRDREEVFLASVHADPLLSTVPLVYVVGPDGV